MFVTMQVHKAEKESEGVRNVSVNRKHKHPDNDVLVLGFHWNSSFFSKFGTITFI